MPGLQAPLGQQEVIMCSKESTYGSFNSSNQVWHAFSTHGPKITTAAIERMPRQSLAKPYPGTGGRSVAMSLDVETDEDTFNQWLYFTLGAQTAPTATLFSSTLTANANTSATSCQLASTNLLMVGQSLTIDSGGSNPETVTVTGIIGINTVSFTPALAHNHTTNATCIVTGGTARMSTFTMGTPLPSFSMQVVRPGGTTQDYLGSCVDSLTLSMAEGQALKAKLNLKAQQVVKDSSPLTPVMSILNPYIFAQQSTAAQIGGEVPGYLSAATLKSWQLTINNNLKENWGFGNGNIVRNFQEQLRAVTGTMTLLFETDTQRSNFDAALNGGNLPPITMLIPILGTDTASSASPYGFGLYMANVFLSSYALADDTSKPTQQTVAFNAAESSPGSNDPVSVTYISKKSGNF